jgi:cobalt/nickel transport system permease protein
VTRTATATPGWLLRPEVDLRPCDCIGRRRKGSYVAKTIEGASGVLRQALVADDTAAHDRLLQRIEARVKLIAALALLVATSLLHHITSLLLMYAATLVLALSAGLSLAFFVKRVWLFVPMFTGVIVLPATLSLITPGDVVVPLGTWFGHEVGITRQGLTAAGLIVLRVATSISLVVLLTLTTTWTKLLTSLRALHVPKMFVLVLAMAYRYIFHLLSAVTDMYTARKARTVAADIDAQHGRAFVAASAGALFGKAHALSEEVYLAMVSRGYTGDVRTLDAVKVRAFDVLCGATAVAAALMLVSIDRGF